ncbi:MAG TPA: HAMP domain-containing sensor histidine kinase [Candidatus Hydrogenedens sp.]|nr:HAMP domain-containing histidine kinase [Candidatus Hydrogenedens sp.]HOK10555.1 HAMP domain-containing sensor histidine kinase [Candidatus Hydrogenedens sp.]HOL18996.1 HAMP domain-containing sensor histidine kinase [Candidatus Hydrogenedens sp.]HPP58952.1 HAMP domain-containing sensor histidine kinase [Candidatus Hydrogenedens sp.]
MGKSEFHQIFPDWDERLKKLHQIATTGLCINSVIHDANNYLGAIMAYAELLQLEPSLNEEHKRLIEKIIDSVRACAEIINSLYTITRAKDLSVALVEIPKLIDKVLTLRSYYHKVLKIDIEKHIETPIKPIVVDTTGIQFALIHLIKNAEDNVELNESSEPHSRLIKISCNEENNGVVVAIHDNGPGIKEDFINKLFVPFTTTKKSHHFGIGLSLVQEIIEEHGGIIKYDKDIGFYFWIPFDNPKKATLLKG